MTAFHCKAHFDTINQRFVIPASASSSLRYYYTFDGSQPTTSSQQYLGAVDIPDDMHSLRDAASAPPFNLLIEDTAKTISEIKTFAFPAALPQPHVSLTDGVLHIEPTVSPQMHIRIPHFKHMPASYLCIPNACTRSNMHASGRFYP